MNNENPSCGFHGPSITEGVIMTKIPVPDGQYGCYIEVPLCPGCVQIMEDQPGVLEEHFLKLHGNEPLQWSSERAMQYFNRKE